MKKILYILIAFTLLISSVSGTKGASAASDPDSLIVLSTPELKDLVARWTEEYKRAAPEAVITVRQVSSMFSWQPDKQGQVGFIQERDIQNMNEAGMRIVVGRNVVVPVVNASNPLLEDIRNKGITPQKIKLLIEDRPTWGDLLGVPQDKAVKLHYLEDASVISAMSGFAGAGPDKMNGTGHSDPGELLNSIINEVYSVGFCRLEDIRSKDLSGKLAILPIDRNGNGTMDANEDIYKDLTAFTRGIWIGKYPKSLYSNIYSVTAESSDENVTDFLNWIITDGQNILPSEGYTGLILTERISGAARIAETLTPVAVSSKEGNIFRTLLIVLVVLAAIILAIRMIMIALKRKPLASDGLISSTGPVLDEKSILLPKGVYFDKTHTWAFMEQDGAVKIGVDDFLLHMTGQVNRVKMKMPGDHVKRGEEVLSVIRNGKQLNLYSPVTGIIREKNSELENNVSMLNSSPYSSGWVYRVEPENWQRENQLLFMADKHRQYIINEITRIKDFFAGLFRESDMQYAPVVLQDGGMLHEGVLSEMSPEVWEEFQTKIIDPSRTVWFYEII